MAHLPLTPHRSTRTLDRLLYPLQLVFAWLLFRIIGVEDADEAPQNETPDASGEATPLPKDPVPHY